MLWNFHKAFSLYKFYSTYRLLLLQNRFSEDRGQQQPKETLVRGDTAAVMEVKNTKVIKVKERKRD